MIARRFIVEIHQDQPATVASILSDHEIVQTINRRLGSLIHEHEIIDAIAVWPTFSQDEPAPGIVLEQNWLPWNKAPHSITEYQDLKMTVKKYDDR